jgi:hypothetical protein
VDGNEGRIVQAEDLTQLRVGIACGWSPGQRTRREQCDHVFHTIERLNDKTDGFYDDLLPGADHDQTSPSRVPSVC